jgi:hypothetical protein
MTIKILTFGGVLISNFTPPRAHYTYEGVHVEWRGSTHTKEGVKAAGVSLDMSAADAMDLVVALMDVVQKHADYEARHIPNFAKRLNKKLQRKK